MTMLTVDGPPLTTQTWTWQGHQIHYTCQGQGQPLILIHGFGACLGHWRKNIPVLAEAGYQVIALDLLGFGASDKPPLDYSLDIWQDLLHDFWHDHVQGPAVWIGNSMGGLITLCMLANHSDLAKAGVLLNAAGGLNMRADELNRLQRFLINGVTALVDSPRWGPKLFDWVRSKPRIRSSLNQVYGNSAAVTDELVEMIHQPACDPGARAVFASILTAPAGPRPSELLPRIQQPLLVLWGEDDPWAALPTAEIYRQLSVQPDANPPVTFRPIANTGHCPHDERPEIVNAWLIEWLQTLA